MCPLNCIHMCPLNCIHMSRVGQHHIFIRIYGVHTVFLAGKSPCIRSYTVCIYGSGQPYTSHRVCTWLALKSTAPAWRLPWTTVTEPFFLFLMHRSLLIYIHDTRIKKYEIRWKGSARPNFYAQTFFSFLCVCFRTSVPTYDTRKKTYEIRKDYYPGSEKPLPTLIKEKEPLWYRVP
jgi:hypothetical protein